MLTPQTSIYYNLWLINLKLRETLDQRIQYEEEKKKKKSIHSLHV